VLNDNDQITYTGQTVEKWAAEAGDDREVCFKNGETYTQVSNYWTGQPKRDILTCPTPTDCVFNDTGEDSECIYYQDENNSSYTSVPRVHQEFKVTDFTAAENGGKCRVVSQKAVEGKLLRNEYELQLDPDEFGSDIITEQVCATTGENLENVLTLRSKVYDESNARTNLCPEGTDTELFINANKCNEGSAKLLQCYDDDGFVYLTDTKEKQYHSWGPQLGVHLKLSTDANTLDRGTYCVDDPDSSGVSLVNDGAPPCTDTFDAPELQACSRSSSQGLCVDGEGLIRDATRDFNAYVHPTTKGLIPSDGGFIKWNDNTCPIDLDCHYDYQALGCVDGYKARKYRVTNYRPAAHAIGSDPEGTPCQGVRLGLTTLGPGNVPSANGTFLAADDNCPGTEPFTSLLSKYSRRYMTGLPNKASSKASSMLGSLQYEDVHFVTPRKGVSEPTPAICESMCDDDDECGGFAATRFNWPNNQPGVACRFFKSADADTLATEEDAGFTLYTKTETYNPVVEPECSLTMSIVPPASMEDSVRDLFKTVWPSFYAEWSHQKEDGTDWAEQSASNLTFDYMTPEKLIAADRLSFTPSYVWNLNSKEGYKCAYKHFLKSGASSLVDTSPVTLSNPRWPHSDYNSISLHSMNTGSVDEESPSDSQQINGMFRFTLYNEVKTELWHHDFSVSTMRLSQIYNDLRLGRTTSAQIYEQMTDDDGVWESNGDVLLTITHDTTLYYTLVSAESRYIPNATIYMRDGLIDVFSDLVFDQFLEATNQPTELAVSSSGSSESVKKIIVSLHVNVYDLYMHEGQYLILYYLSRSEYLEQAWFYLRNYVADKFVSTIRSDGVVEYDEVKPILDALEANAEVYQTTHVLRYIQEKFVGEKDKWSV
jgi:hypothetical protein